jgi:hypothetical protein
MSVTKKTLIGEIDLTPTWAQQAANCIIILKNSKDPEAIEVAEKELLRIGGLLDLCVARGRS